MSFIAASLSYREFPGKSTCFSEASKEWLRTPPDPSQPLELHLPAWPLSPLCLSAPGLQDLSYKDRHWHEACFRCSRCRGSLVDKPFAAKEDQLLCTDCYSQEYSSRCQECKKGIMPGGCCDPAFRTCAKSPSPNPPVPPQAPLHPAHSCWTWSWVLHPVRVTSWPT